MKIDSVELKTIAVRQSQYPEEILPEFLLVEMCIRDRVTTYPQRKKAKPIIYL